MWQNKSNGFTLVEVLVISPIIVLIIGGFIALIVSMTSEVMTTRANNTLTYDVQSAIDKIEGDVKMSTAFLSNVNSNIPIVSPQGYNNDTTNLTNVGTNGNMLILQALLTDKNPAASDRKLVYVTDQPNTCSSPQVTYNKVATGIIVYFIKDSSLWRRTILPASVNGCSTPWQISSCYPGQSGSPCTTEDVKLVKGVTSENFDITYYPQASSSTASTVAVDSGVSDATRQIALSSVSTVQVDITGQQTVAGRDISQTLTTHIDRLNSVAAADTPAAPAVPLVTGVYAAADSAKFSWPAIAGASSYNVDYNINGGAWNVGAASTASTSYTVQATRKNVVNVRVSANNNGATSAYGVASFTIPDWNPIMLQSSWTNYGGEYSTAAYTKTTDGVVILKGLIRKQVGTFGAGETILTLPVGYRPSALVMFTTKSGFNTPSRIDISPAGVVAMSVASVDWVSLDGIKFLPAGSQYTWNTPAFSSGWANFNPGWASAVYTKDASGRVHTQGLVASGSTAEGSDIITLPAGYNSAEYLHLPTAANNSFASLGAPVAGALEAKGTPMNSYLSLQQMFYSATPVNTTGWQPLGLMSLWVQYPGFATASYIRSSDGIVTLKGLIRSGTTTGGLTIAVLPAGYRPSATLLVQGNCVNLPCRFDIRADGSIVIGEGVSAGWSALDGISFMAEQ